MGDLTSAGGVSQSARGSAPRQAAFDAEGNPTQAALGFAKKCGVELSEIDQSGPKLRFSQVIVGKPTASLLPIEETKIRRKIHRR